MLHKWYLQTLATLLLLVLPIEGNANWYSKLCCLPTGWEIGAHALYWTPTAPVFRYLLNNPSSTAFDATSDGVEFTFDWGVAINGCYHCNLCMDLCADYTYFEPHQRDEVIETSGSSLGIDFDPSAGLATAHERYHFQQASLFFNQKLLDGCLTAAIVSGLRYTYIENSRRAATPSSPTSILPFAVTRSSGWGLGIIAGGVIDYHILCGFHIEVRANGGTVAGGQRISETVVQTNDISEFRYDKQTICIPLVDLYAGLAYCFCTPWVNVRLEAAYEQHYYHNVLQFASTFAAGPQTATQGVGFGGLTFGGRVIF